MSIERKAVDASTSNAGDDFHLDWAVRQCLELLRPDTNLTAVKPEGITPTDASVLDPSGQALLAVDLTEYYDGTDFETSSRVIYSQLKYSTTNQTAPWTVAEVVRGKNKATCSGSLIRKLAKLFKSHVDAHGRSSVLLKLQLRLVSNRPTHPQMTSALRAAKEELSDQAVNQRTKLLSRIDSNYRSAHDDLFRASGLKSGEYCDFVRVLDLSSCTDELQRVRQEIEISRQLVQHGFLETSLQRAKLKTRIWDLSQPSETGSINREELVSLLSGSYHSLFPAPTSITLPKSVVQRDQSPSLAKKIVDASTNVICVHGGGGFGKTTLLNLVVDHLPLGSICVTFDCFAAGAYKDPENRRHLHKYAIRQIFNELSVATKTDLLLNSDLDDNDLTRAFVEKMQVATRLARARAPSALVCVIVDAADNSVCAAEEQQHKSFVHDLVRCRIPEGGRIVVSSRTHRVNKLELDEGAIHVPVKPFSLGETTKKVRLRHEQLSDAQISDFHKLSNGNPRVQEYALSLSADDFERVLEFLRPTGKTLDDLFERAISEAGLRNGSSVLVENVCRAFANLPRPVPIHYLGILADTNCEAVRDVCTDLVSGLYIIDDSVNLRDESFDDFLSDNYPITREMSERRADTFIAQAASSEYASRNLGLALIAAGKTSDLLDAVDRRLGIESWCDKPRNIRYEDTEFLTYGHRLWFAQDSLLRFLGEKSCSLIAEVQIRRSVHEGKLEDVEETERSEGKYDWKSRIFVIDKGGEIASINRTHRLGETNLS